jgi:large subunit ribosomal protein L35
MPKMKTHRGAAKRFKATGKGRLKHKQPYTSHILTSKTTKRKRQLRAAAYLSEAESKAMKRLLPYL